MKPRKTSIAASLLAVVVLAAGTESGSASVTTSGGLKRWADFAGVAAYRDGDLARIARIGVKRVRMDNPSARTLRTAARYGI
jgi:hypothetical protein